MPPRTLYEVKLRKRSTEVATLTIAAESESEAEAAAEQLADNPAHRRWYDLLSWDDDDEEVDVKLVRPSPKATEPDLVYDGTDVYRAEAFDDWEKQDLSDEGDDAQEDDDG